MLPPVNLKRELESTLVDRIPTAETDLLMNDSLLIDDNVMSAWFARQDIDTCIGKDRLVKKRTQFLQETYSEKQVRALCIKYRLRCLPVNLFKGEMDAQTPVKKRAFASEFSQVMEEFVEEMDYRIVAPSELYRVAYGNLDPLLLYRFSYQGNIYYKFVHQWGGELNGWRSLVNYPLRSLTHLSVCSILAWLPIILTVCFSLNGLTMPSTLFLSGFLLIGTLVCTLSFFTNRHGQYQTSDRVWDSQPVV